MCRLLLPQEQPALDQDVVPQLLQGEKLVIRDEVAVQKNNTINVPMHITFASNHSFSVPCRCRPVPAVEQLGADDLHPPRLFASKGVGSRA
jgi:hypothetical protein